MKLVQVLWLLEQQDANERRINKVKCERLFESNPLNQTLCIAYLVIWSILPVVIRSSQRLSHACVSLNRFSVKLRMAHYISYSLFGIVVIWITVVILGLIHVFSFVGNHEGSTY